MSGRVRLAVLVSGSGTNLQAILDACARPDYPAEVVVVVSDRPEAFALERARRAGVPAHVVDWSAFRDREAFCRRLEAVLAPYRVDLVCLAGFLRILDARFVAAYRGRILNIHPSLLPAFGGKGMYGERVHRAVLASGARVSGCTVHFVTEAVDAGPIVLQAEVPVLPGDTPQTLAARVAQQEHRIYPEAIRRVALGEVRGEDVVARRG
ncbi:MAG: phosphoribosylglycinamide formyltransferase [Armatimonadota bacterium]|nr:phosphoribosylglycinamide formyltransferase [Armatimonadota bacterium]MDR7438772.1 phosphoribosylglycinamide formyltransferase [Armatimonadota bacterium]MDR7561988.1 phosphoribosylglycinamide formyltransferase [Armatimonadota bacterium]MDR7568543.1 phosphoribosylglycinamide formyltransferase [Armatimonadota bacterium]MDR7602573.1 phosphoribosylglycinamide formyltransferase [Armatimonadota bacterium]